MIQESKGQRKKELCSLLVFFLTPDPADSFLEVAKNKLSDSCEVD